MTLKTNRPAPRLAAAALIALALAGAAQPSLADAPPSAAVTVSDLRGEADPARFLQGFFAWYTGRIFAPIPRDVDPAQKKALADLLTPSFHKALPRLIKQTGADPVLCAQDFLDSWTSPAAIRVEVLKRTTDTAVARVRLGSAGETPHVLRATLRLSGQRWLVDGVADENG